MNDAHLHASISYDKVSIEGCELKYTETTTRTQHTSSNGDWHGVDQQSFVVPLAKVITLKADTVWPSINEVWELRLSTDAEAITRHTRKSSEGGPYSSWDTSMNKETTLDWGQPKTNNQDIATQMQKAFDVLTRYCKANAHQTN
jgi:hypothetical protein